MKTDFSTKLLRLGVDCDGDRPASEVPERLFAFQTRTELIRLCEWIEKKEIKSYLEIGFYRGGLMSALHELFRFERVMGCDEGLVQKRRELHVSLPKEAKICWAKSESPEYRRFRHAMGKIDLVFIDGDHSYGSVRQDFEREKKQPHRFLAFHDIKNEEKAPGVVRLWREIGGKKKEIFSPREGADKMGIGLWSQTETP